MMKNNRKDKNKASQTVPGKRNRPKIMSVIIIPIIAFAILSIFIFMNSRGESDGIAVGFTIHALNKDNGATENQLIAGKEALLTFTLIDNKTGQTISGLDPDIHFELPGEHDETKPHKHFEGYHLTGGELNPAKVQIFVLNSERSTIEVLDTFGNYDPRPPDIKKLGTMTSTVITLKGSPKQKAGDIVAGRFGNYVYATLPGENQVAIVNTISHEVIKYIDVGAMPGRMFLQPKSKYLWVSNDGSGDVSIIDTDTNVLAETIETGKGYHEIAFSSENAYVTNSEHGTVTVIRLRGFVKQKEEIQGNGIDYSNASNEIYITNSVQGTVTAINEKDHKVRKQILLDKGIETIKFTPDGRRCVVLNRHGNTAYLIDAENDNFINAVKTGEAPNAVEFMGEYALIRNTNSPDLTYVSMIDPAVSNNVDIGIEPTMSLMPHSLITTSYGDEGVITSPREGKIWFMHTMDREPMAMSSATVEYGGDAAAIVENKLHETSPGVYQQYIMLDRAGPLIIEFEAQNINSMFKIEVMPDTSIGFQTTLLNKSFIPEENSIIQYRIIDRKTGMPEENLTDLEYLVIKPGASKGMWTKRLPTRNLGNGTYEARTTFPEEGDYMITVTSNMLSIQGYEAHYDYFTVKNH